MAKPKNPPKKNPPKKNVKTRFVDGKLEPFPKRGKPKQNIRKAAGSGPAPNRGPLTFDFYSIFLFCFLNSLD